MLTVNMGWVRVPLHAWLADTEAVGIHKRRVKVNAVQLLAVLGMVHLVQPCCGREKVRVRARLNLGLRPAATWRPVSEPPETTPGLVIQTKAGRTVYLPPGNLAMQTGVSCLAPPYTIASTSSKANGLPSTGFFVT